jgi:polysaccharide biosynthesis protein PslG
MAVALALPAVASSPAAAAKRVPQSFVGVVADGPLLNDPNVRYDKQLDTMVGGGVQTLRTSFNWSGVQPYRNFAAVPAGQEDRFRDEHGVPTDFSGTDRIVRTAAERRMRVLPVLIAAPDWAARSPGHLYSPPSNFAAYARYAADLVRRYGRRGTFWSENAGVPKLPIDHWQIWNEPSLKSFWSDHPWAPDYVKLLKKSRTAIKAADPHAKVVLAGLPNESWTYLEKIYAAGGHGQFDVAAFHPFTAKVSGVKTILKRDRQVMAAHGDKRKPLLVTELSWTAAKGKTHVTYGNEQTARGQASRLSAAYSMLAKERKRLRIQRVYWYTWLSYDRDRFYPFDWAGLLKLKGRKVTQKPAFRAFRKVALRLEGCHSKRGRADRCAS